MSLKPTTHNLDSIARSILLGTIALLPIIFTPKLFISLEVTKFFVLYLGVGIAFIFWLLGRLVDGTIAIPKSKLLLSLGGIALAGVITTCFSPVFHASFMGNGFEGMSLMTIVTLVVMTFLTSIYVRSEKQVLQFFGSMIAETLLLGVFEVIHTLVGLYHLSWVSLGYFYTAVANPVGSFSDLALFLGAFLLVGLFAWEFLPLSRAHKIVLGSGMAISTLVLALINFSLVWGLLGALALVIFVFILMLRRTETANKKQVPILPLVVVLISFLFVFESQFIGGFLSRTLGVSYIDYRPSVTSTLTVARHTLWHNPVIGSGLNRFSHDWALYHPVGVLQSEFWDSSFVSGFSWLATTGFSMGILGIIAVLYFLGMYVYTLARHGLLFEAEKRATFSLMSLSVLSVFFMVAISMYVPGPVILGLCFMTIGALIGVLVKQGVFGEMEFSFLKDPRHSFFSILAFVLLFLMVSASVFSSIEKYTSYVFFERGAALYTANGPTSSAEAMLSRALFFNNSDDFSRSLTDFYLAKIKNVLNTQGLSDDAIKSNFQSILTQAETVSANALSIDSTDYQNYTKIAGLYQALVPLSVTGAYTNANDAYVKALLLNPNNPGILLARATLELTNKNADGARGYISQALAVKPNYIDAYLLRAQLESTAGNNDVALQSAETATQIDPTNTQAFLTLGLLRYTTGSYDNAITAFSRATVLSPDSVDAFYYLGLAYDKAGRHDDALADFKVLAKAFPNVTAFTTIVNNITAGNTALTGLTKDSATTVPVATETTTKPAVTIPAKIAPVKLPAAPIKKK